MTEGFVLVDKPATWTSHDVIGKLRRIFAMKRVGHAGTLDPMATGLLVIGLGTSTRLLRFIQELPKTYEAEVRFGVATDTGDRQGEPIAEAAVEFVPEEVSQAASSFVGTIDQVPPQVSAIKRGGKRMHRLAREGVEVELEPRPVQVYELEVTSVDLPTATLRVTCGKGTYIRVLAEDIAKSLGTRAHLTALRRTKSGSLSVDQASSIEELEQIESAADLVLDPVTAMGDFPAVIVPADQVHAVRHGAPVEVEAPTGIVTAVDDGELIGVYRSDGNRLVPEAVVA